MSPAQEPLHAMPTSRRGPRHFWRALSMAKAPSPPAL